MRWLPISVLVLFVAASVSAEFTNVTIDAGVDYLQWEPIPGDFSSKRVTGGAAAGDVDGDGFPDLFVTRLDAPDILFRNKDGTGFERMVSAGFDTIQPTNGAAMADVDNDGDLDIYATSVGAHRYYLYINDGTGHFSEQGRQRGAAIETDWKHFGMSSTFGDYDQDGFLDVHVTEWGNNQFDPGESLPSWSHMKVLNNLGAANPGYFRDSTIESKILLDHIFGFGPNREAEGVWAFTSTFADFDRDGFADLAVVGDFHTSQLFWNNGDGTFTMAPREGHPNASGIGTDENGMGSAVADFNGDGLLDWFVTSIYDPKDPCIDRNCTWNSSGNRLFLNNGDRTFTDATDLAGVRDGHWGWGATFFDYDNDGDLDLTMTNGIVSSNEFSQPFHNDPMKLWRNDGDGTFTEVAILEGLDDTGSGKGLLTLDYDQDGDLDLFVVNNGDHPKLFRNDAPEENAFLKVKTVGTRSNRDGIGAFLTLTADEDGPEQTRYITGGGTNYLSQSDMTVHFGLGPRETSLYELKIDWPSGRSQVFSDIMINATLTAIEPVPEPTSIALVTVLSIGSMFSIRTLRPT